MLKGQEGRKLVDPARERTRPSPEEICPHRVRIFAPFGPLEILLFGSCLSGISAVGLAGILAVVKRFLGQEGLLPAEGA